MLVLNELVGEISSTYVRDFHTNLDKFGFDREIRYAMVVRDPHARAILSLGIALARDAGWDIAIFSQESAAKEWLARALP